MTFLILLLAAWVTFLLGAGFGFWLHWWLTEQETDSDVELFVPYDWQVDR